jgi:hypothetical protein
MKTGKTLLVACAALLFTVAISASNQGMKPLLEEGYSASTNFQDTTPGKKKDTTGKKKDTMRRDTSLVHLQKF